MLVAALLSLSSSPSSCRLLHPVGVDGTTLMIDDRILVAKFIYRLSLCTGRRHRVPVSSQPQRDFVKRVLGLPGTACS